jgi:hypothetical protein
MKISELEIGHRVILTGKIFSSVEAIENRHFYRSKAVNENAVILTFILTL